MIQNALQAKMSYYPQNVCSLEKQPQKNNVIDSQNQDGSSSRKKVVFNSWK